MCTESSCKEGTGGLTYLLLSSTLLALGVVFLVKRRRKAKQSSAHKKEVSEETVYSALDSSLLENFQDVNELLEKDLRRNISEKISNLKSEIKVRSQELRRSLNTSLQDKVEELRLCESKYRGEVDHIQAKYQHQMEQIQIEFQADILRMRDSLKNLKVILSDSLEDKDRLETGRQELECPVCLEEMRPPRRIWQCADGHPVCELCRKKPEVTCCPACRKYLVGRSTIAEKLARAVFGEEKKITLTGYKQVDGPRAPS